MKMIFICILQLIIMNVSANERGGGVIVGNGAGLVENEFQLAYQTIDQLIDNCLPENICRLNQREQLLVLKIKDIVIFNRDKKDRLVFLSEKLNPGFFTTGLSEHNRIAKTFTDPSLPVYINIDLLYTASGEPALHNGEIVSILIHELGHQSNELDHTLLDILGAKLARFFAANTQSYILKAEEISIGFLITNFDVPEKTARIIFNWKNEFVKDLSAVLYSSVSCEKAEETLSGLSVTNGHYTYDEKQNLFFKAWVMADCRIEASGEIRHYRHDLSVMLDQAYRYQGLFIE